LFNNVKEDEILTIDGGDMHKLVKIFFIIFLFIVDSAGTTEQIYKANVDQNYVNYADPFIGTDYHGHTFPGATTPFGMVQLSPDTGAEGWDWCSGYHYSDNSIMGFSHTHLSGTGCGDYGNILFMPTIGKIKTVPGPKDNPDEGYRSKFSQSNENAKPGYYSVFLDDYKVKVELTATPHVGVHRYTFPVSNESHILIDLIHRIRGFAAGGRFEVVDNQTVQGYTYSDQSGGGWCASGAKYKVYFIAKFSKPFISYGTWDRKGTHYESKSSELINDFEKIKRKPDASSDETENLIASDNKPSLGGFVTFKTEENEEITTKVGISFVSIEGAKKNLEKEVSHFDFDKIKKDASALWNKMLLKIEIKKGEEKDLRTFYTALYHSLIAPNIFSDVDGRYIGMDGKIYNSGKFPHYTVFSLWDTFRSLHPLMALVYPEMDTAFVNSLLEKYDQGGWLPIWELSGNYTNCMIGDHSVSVIVDAYVKGLTDFDINKAYEAMRKGALEEPSQEHTFKGRIGLEWYKNLGYIPADKIEQSVSRTLEYAYNDFCVATMAKLLDRDVDYNYFIKRSKFYKNVFDPHAGFMRGRNSDGAWAEPFDPLSSGYHSYFTEGNAWQYSWFVPHEVYSLINLMGGEQKFISKLDQLFDMPSTLIASEGEKFNPHHGVTGLIGQYAHGNEPSHHAAYLYNYAGAPHKTQEKINQIVHEMYSDKPDGLCGNEDVGQMSAWYIFSTLGFYPICPGNPTYDVGTPLFENVVLHLKNGDLNITANNLSSRNIYVKNVKLNGKKLDNFYFNHKDIAGGGVLHFEMSPTH